MLSGLLVANATAAEVLVDRIRSRSARVGIVGLGYVGLPLAVEFAKAGFRVSVFLERLSCSNPAADTLRSGGGSILSAPE